MGEMRLKIEFYREKISQDAAYATQIRALQEHVESQGEEQRRTLEEFSSYKQHAEETEQVFYFIFNCTHVRTYSILMCIFYSLLLAHVHFQMNLQTYIYAKCGTKGSSRLAAFPDF